MRRALVVLSLAACGSKAAPTAARYHWDSESALSNFMKKKINPSFSKLSFLLFHDEQDAPGDDLSGVARELAAAADELHAWPTPPGDSAQARQVFYEYAAAMKLDGIQLVSAVKSGTREQAQQRFEKLREKCDSCHHFFRYGQ